MTFPFPFSRGSGPASETGHRYWRLYITDNNGASLVAIPEIELYDDVLGRNIAQSATITASSTYLSYAASYAVDGNAYDNQLPWASNLGAGFPQWLKFDFGTPQIVKGFGLHGRITTYLTHNPKDFKLQYSDDDSIWTDYITPASQSSWNDSEFKVFWSGTRSYSGSPWGSHSYWRIVCKASETVSIPCIGEMEFRATPSGSDQASGGTASASSEYSGSFPASNAFDNNSATLWAAASEPAWLKYQFASPVEVSEVMIRARSDESAFTAPRSFVIQFADSGSGPWTTAFGRSNETGWTLGEARNFTDPLYV